MALGITNKEEIISASDITIGERFTDEQKSLFSIQKRAYQFGKDENEVIDFHVYDEFLNHIYSDYEIKTWQKKENVEYNGKTLPVSNVRLRIEDDVQKANLPAGKYKLCYNFLKKLIGSYDSNSLFISEISPSRTEARIKILNETDFLIKDFIEFGNIDDPYFKANSSIAVNLGKNRIFYIINWLLDTVNTPQKPYSLVVKFFNPLPDEILENSVCWIVQEISLPIFIPHELKPIETHDLGYPLRGPNFNVSYQIGGDSTDYYDYDTVITQNEETKRYIAENYLDREIFFENVNVDYSKFSDFCFFGSAKKRIHNLKYKLTIIKQIDDLIESLTTASVSSSAAMNQVINLRNKKKEIYVKMDDYEKFLTSEKGKYIIINGNPFDVTVPKINSSKPYLMFPVGSVEFESWFQKMSMLAEIYDSENPNMLRKYLPIHVLEDPENDYFLNFIDMIGHHFDILWLNIKSMASMYNFGHGLNEGIAGELAFFVARSLGLDIIEGKDFVNLVQYILGNDNEEIAEEYLPYAKISREIWKRLLNNLPYILKTKGTHNSIIAVLNCFGIPSNVLKIREFEYVSEKGNYDRYYDNENFRYCINLEGNQRVLIPWTDYRGGIKPQSYVFRFRTSVDPDNVNQDHQVLLEKNNAWCIKIKNYGLKTNPSLGEISFILSGSSGFQSCSISNIPVYNDLWWSVMLRLSDPLNSSNLNQPMRYELFCKQYNFEQIVFNRSASLDISSTLADSYNSSFYSSTPGQICLGGHAGSIFGNGFFGNLQEFRMWNEPISEKVFDNYVRSAFSYEGNHLTSSFENLVVRYSFNVPKNHFLEYAIKDENPSKIKFNATASGFLNGAKHYNYDILRSRFLIPRNVVQSYVTNNVKITNNALTSENKPYATLHFEKRVSDLTFDDNDVPTSRVGVYFSVSQAVNEDMIAYFADFRIDDYIGSPNDYFEEEYKDLRKIQNFYLLKDADFVRRWHFYFKTLYYYDKNLFNIIRECLPARATKIVGIAVEPTMLERPKIKFYPLTANGLKIASKINLIFKELQTDLDGLFAHYDKVIKELNSDVDNLFAYCDRMIKELNSDTENLFAYYDRLIKEINSETENLFASLEKTMKELNAIIEDKSVEIEKMIHDAFSTYENFYDVGLDKPDEKIESEIIQEFLLNGLEKFMKEIRGEMEFVMEFKYDKSMFEVISRISEDEISLDCHLKDIEKIIEEYFYGAEVVDADEKLNSDKINIEVKLIENVHKKTYLHKYRNKYIDYFDLDENLLNEQRKGLHQFLSSEINRNTPKWILSNWIQKSKKNMEIIETVGRKPIKVNFITNYISRSYENLYYKGCKQYGDPSLPFEKWTTPDNLPVVQTFINQPNKVIVTNKGINDSDSNIIIN